MNRQHLYPLFLGPYGENNDILEKLLVEFLRDHVYWRRNFHPEDPPAIPTLAAQTPQYQSFVADMARELHALSGALKRSVPFSSPRYMGHMTSDLLLPSLIAQMMTLPYNPNNVVDEAAPVTLDMEISVGLQLARMFGFETDETSPQCAFGHLTSGGTVANYEALNVQRALRHYPLAVATALRKLDIALVSPRGTDMRELDAWTLANFGNRETIRLHEAVLATVSELETGEGHRLLDTIKSERLETLGWAEFSRRHPAWREPVVLLPVTAHYSWQKSMKLIGLGEAQLRQVPEQGMRMRASALDEMLGELHAAGTPVLAVVGVLGTTEFGTIDPVHDIVALRDAWHGKGLYAPVHIDAAWGGYLAALFREADGSFVAHGTVQNEFRYFPSQHVHAAFQALSRADSITVDPHKLGFVPFGAGAIVFRDQRMLDLVSQAADYVFDPERQAPGYREKFRQLGRYILEGSKSGAAAAGVYVGHRVLPPHREGLGRVIRETILSTEYFFDRVNTTADDLRDVATLLVPIEPDSNLVCLAMNPRGNTRLDVANRFARAVFQGMKVDASVPVQTREFFGSYTMLTRRGLGDAEFNRIVQELGISDVNSDRIFILRHTLMNPWLLESASGINFVDRYCDFLGNTIRRTSEAFRNEPGTD